jgi:hypothetical protein
VIGQPKRMSQLVMDAQANEAFDDVLATIVGLDDVIAMDREGAPAS